jgi:hypothetical protein
VFPGGGKTGFQSDKDWKLVGPCQLSLPYWVCHGGKGAGRTNGAVSKTGKGLCVPVPECSNAGAQPVRVGIWAGVREGPGIGNKFRDRVLPSLPHAPRVWFTK